MMHVVDAVLDSFTRLFDITNREVVQGIEETGLREVPQQHKREDSEEHKGDNNGGNNCAYPRKDRKRGGNTNLRVPPSNLGKS